MAPVSGPARPEARNLMPSTASSRPRRSPRAALALLCLLSAVVMLAVGCASSGGAAGGADDGVRSNRTITVRFGFEDEEGTRRVIFRDGGTETLQYRDVSYTVRTLVSRTEVGKIDLALERQEGGRTVTTQLTLRVGEELQLSTELGDAWPYLWLKVVRVRPPIRQGPNPISDY